MTPIHFKRQTLLILMSVLFLTGCMTLREPEFEQQIEKLKPDQLQGMPQVPNWVQVGEKLHFSIRWIGLEVGTAVLSVEGIEKVGAKDAYHVSLYVKSNKLIDVIYPVRDEHHSYIDVEHFHSLRYEKVLSEGRYRADEVMTFNQVTHQATYESKRSGSQKQMLIPKDVHDQISAAFWLRRQAMKPGDKIYIPVNADEKNWKLEVRVLKSGVKTTDLGTFEALEIEPRAQFQGVFVRRGKFVGWMSMDEKRLPLVMRSKIPILGSIYMVLTKVEGWDHV